MHTMKKFIRYYAPYKAVFFLDLICAAVISLVDLAFPQILRILTKTLFAEPADRILQALLPIGAGLLVIYILQALCKYYVSYQGHMMGANMERDMRQQLFDHYEKLSFSYYDQNNSGQMMSKLVSDLFDISEFAHHGPENLFISLIKIIGSFIFLFLINWRLAIPLLVLVVFMLFFSYGQNKKMQATFMDNRRKIGDVNSSLQDTLAGIRVVQSFANEEIEREKFRKSNQGFLRSKDANYKCMGSFMSGNLFFQGMMYLVTLVFGGWLIGPAPAISTSSPSASKESAVCVAFPNGSKIAYISSGMFGLHGHTLLDGITRYSANAPLRFTPTPFASLQFSLCPSRQLRHFPHVICPSPDTRSPILNPCTPSPFSTISPTYS